MTDADLLLELRRVYDAEWPQAPRTLTEAIEWHRSGLLAVYDRGRRDGATQQRESDRDYMRTAYRTDVLRGPLVPDAVPSQD